MIGYFVKPRYRHDLARCAVIFPLFVLSTLILPILGYPLWKTFIPPDSSGWLLGLPFWLWIVWAVRQWFELVGMIRAEPQRSNSVGVFHTIQATFLGMAIVMPLITAETENLSFLPIMLICVEVAVVIFLANYFLLALVTKTRPSWQAISALALAAVSLSYEIWSVTRPTHH